MSCSKERNIAIFEFAQKYLNSILPQGMTPSDLDKYYLGDRKEVTTLREVYIEFLASAQEYQRMPNVIQFRKRQKEIGEILQDFDYNAVADMSETELYYAFRESFNVTSADSKRNSWYKWSCSAVDAARFVSQFKSMEDFRSFIARFNYNSSTRMALPLLISTKIRGMGFALACNMLKELGYLDYPKPDTHIIDICEALGLSSRNPYEAFEAIVRLADDNGVSPYKVDKVFWLICSGRFYHDNIATKRHKSEFIQAELEMLSNLASKQW